MTDSKYPSIPPVEVLRAPRIAIIDDDIQLARAVARILHANYDCAVKGYNSLEDFLASIDKKSRDQSQNEEEFDLILLDFHLPGQNGPRLIQELQKRKSPLLHQSRILGITGDSEEGIVSKFKDVGIEEILEKPLRKFDYGTIAKRAYGIGSGEDSISRPKPEILKTYI